MHTTLPLCPACGGKLPAEAAFCPFCGTRLSAVQEVPDGAKALLSRADAEKDPIQKYALLLQAQEQYPDCLAVAEALLFHGRLHERSPRKLDFSVIKCYLWHMYLTPKEFSDEKKAQMRTELFEHPQLLRCRQLASDADDFTRRYLQRLACEFVALFLKGSNHYTRTWFGFRLDNRMSRVLAEPVADMLRCIRQDMALEASRRALLYEALYRGFLIETGSESKWLDEKLEAMGYPIPTTR